MGSDPITPPILVFGGPYSNLRATQAMRARAEELGIPPSLHHLHRRRRRLLRRARGDHGRSCATGAAT